MVIWGVDIGRKGEFMQVATLGRALGGEFEHVQLSHEGTLLHPLPEKPPQLIISFGRAAKTALQMAGDCKRCPCLVHLGTPGKTPISAFDLIIPMPQDDYPAAPNVQFLHLPLNGAAEAVWPHPPQQGPSTLIIGGTSRHFWLNRRAIRQLVTFGQRLAAANEETLRVVTSPRTPAGVLAELAQLQQQAGFTLHSSGEVPFNEILQQGTRFVVTADSASMLAEACRTGAPVWLFPLAYRPTISTLLQHAVDFCFGPALRHNLVKRGLIGGGTNFQRWHRALEAQGYIRRAAGNVSDEALRWRPSGPLNDTDLQTCKIRILKLLKA